MKTAFAFIATTILFFSPLSRAQVELRPTVASTTAGTVDYQFDLYDTKAGQNLGDGDMAIDMEKKLHLLVYDPALREFQHLHPEYDGKAWHVQMNFSVDGTYWVWAQGKVAKTKKEFSSPNHLDVSGGTTAWPAPPKLGDVRSGASGISAVALSGDDIYAGEMAMLEVTFTRTNGTDPELSPYLGAFAHVVAVSNAGDTLEHVHPMDNGNNSGMLHATFPTAGDYRLWIQFVDGGELKVVPLSVSVLSR